MATQVDYPNAIGTADAWTLAAGASKIIAVGSGDATDATYIATAASSGDLAQKFTFPALPPADDPVTSCDMSATTRTEPVGPGGGSYFVFDGANWDAFALTNTYVTETTPHFSDSPSVINASEGGVRSNNIDQQTRCSQIYRTTVYTPAQGGGFVFLLHLLLPVLGAGLTFERFVDAVRTLRNSRFTFEEKIELWKTWREYRHPRFA